jgi:hypothetical protein
MPVATIMALARDGTFSRSPFSLGMTSASTASTFLAGAFGAAFLLAQFGTGQARLLRGSEPVTAKSQPGDDAARRAPLDSGASSNVDCANPLAEGSRAKVFVPPERPRSDRRRREGKPDRANEGGAALLSARSIFEKGETLDKILSPTPKPIKIPGRTIRLPSTAIPAGSSFRWRAASWPTRGMR